MATRSPSAFMAPWLQCHSDSGRREQDYYAAFVLPEAANTPPACMLTSRHSWRRGCYCPAACRRSLDARICGAAQGRPGVSTATRHPACGSGHDGCIPGTASTVDNDRAHRRNDLGGSIHHQRRGGLRPLKRQPCCRLGGLAHHRRSRPEAVSDDGRGSFGPFQRQPCRRTEAVANHRRGGSETVRNDRRGRRAGVHGGMRQGHHRFRGRLSRGGAERDERVACGSRRNVSCVCGRVLQLRLQHLRGRGWVRRRHDKPSLSAPPRLLASAHDSADAPAARPRW